jgi:hypothetical protein
MYIAWDMQYYYCVAIVEPGYNDIDLYDTSPIESHFLWYELIRHC